MTGNTEGRKLAAKVTAPIIDWEPAPGYLLCKALKREELAALYNRGTAGKLGLPDKVGKVSDSVGVGQVVKPGGLDAKALLMGRKLDIDANGQQIGTQAAENVESAAMIYLVRPGDYIAWMPFTDMIIEIDGQKYSLVGYDKIRAVRKGDTNGK
jgi:hypothetical protein